MTPPLAGSRHILDINRPKHQAYLFFYGKVCIRSDLKRATRKPPPLPSLPPPPHSSSFSSSIFYDYFYSEWRLFKKHFILYAAPATADFLSITLSI